MLDKIKKEWEEAQKKEENKKTRVVYFGEKPRDIKFDALGQPILIASEVDGAKPLVPPHTEAELLELQIFAALIGCQQFS